MAWIFPNKLAINNSIMDSLVVSESALSGWTESTETMTFSPDSIISLGDIKASRAGNVSYGFGYGESFDCIAHFYNESNNWYYRAFVIEPNLFYTQLTQSYDEDIYTGICVNHEYRRAGLITVKKNRISGDYTLEDIIFKYSNTISFEDFYTSLTKALDLKYTSNGGGATHIAKVTGQLSSLSNNLSDILIVSGGGGGGLLVGDTDYSGKEAGGISGSGDNSADQSTGYAFGQGESITDASGGGGGLYGGYKGTSAKSGGAGSGYIGNSLLSNKKMVGYNVPTSDVESTKTESANEASESPVSGKPKIGNGYARIKFLHGIQS